MRSLMLIWLEASRPKTLPLACLAIVLGSFLAWLNNNFSWLVLVLSLTTASLLQVLSNLANDYGDGLRGVDNAQRLGPVRALQSGALTPQQLKKSLSLVSILAIISGLALLNAAQLNWQQLGVFIGFGASSIVAALAYTLGKRPYGYLGLGDLSVGIFFGYLGVLGSYYLHGAPLDSSLLLPASASGMLAIGVLNINNLRDLDNDAQNGKYTLAVFLGFRAAKVYQVSLVLGALSLFVIYSLNTQFLNWALLSVFTALNLGLSFIFLRLTLQAESPLQIGYLLPKMVALAALITSLFILNLAGAKLIF